MINNENISETDVIQLIPESEKYFIDLLVEIIAKNIIESNRLHTDIPEGSIQLLNTGTD